MSFSFFFPLYLSSFGLLTSCSRGKKIFRPYGDVASTTEVDSLRQRQLRRSAVGSGVWDRPLTRSQLQPRRLNFEPTRSRRTSFTADIDSEADTDVNEPDEDVVPTHDDSHGTSKALSMTGARFDFNPRQVQGEHADSPMIPPPRLHSPSFHRVNIEDGPGVVHSSIPLASPRNTDCRDDEPALDLPAQQGALVRGSVPSPFDSWQRTKTGARAKRAADSMEGSSSGATGKRTRSFEPID